MPWNKPGSGGDDRDPWSQNNGSNGDGRRGQQNGPPDIDEVLRDAKNRISDLFGGGSKGGGSRRNNGSEGPSSSMIGIVAGLVVVGWLGERLLYGE